MANHKTPSEKVQTEGIESVPGQNHGHEVSGTTSPDEAASPAQLDDPVESVPFSTIMGMSYVPAISCGLVLVVRILAQIGFGAGIIFVSYPGITELLRNKYR